MNDIDRPRTIPPKLIKKAMSLNLFNINNRKRMERIMKITNEVVRTLPK